MKFFNLFHAPQIFLKICFTRPKLKPSKNSKMFPTPQGRSMICFRPPPYFCQMFHRPHHFLRKCFARPPDPLRPPCRIKNDRPLIPHNILVLRAFIGLNLKYRLKLRCRISKKPRSILLRKSSRTNRNYKRHILLFIFFHNFPIQASFVCKIIQKIKLDKYLVSYNSQIYPLERSLNWSPFLEGYRPV